MDRPEQYLIDEADWNVSNYINELEAHVERLREAIIGCSDKFNSDSEGLMPEVGIWLKNYAEDHANALTEEG